MNIMLPNMLSAARLPANMLPANMLPANMLLAARLPAARLPKQNYALMESKVYEERNGQVVKDKYIKDLLFCRHSIVV